MSLSLLAQAPQQFSYQAVIRNSSNALITSTKIGMKISLLQGSATENAVYVETHTPITNTNGLVSIAIGGGAKDSLSWPFANIDWSKGPYFVKTETDPAGGTNYSLTTTSQLLSVPYALYAANSPPGPKGETGAQGPAGKVGAQGPKGDIPQVKVIVSVVGDTMRFENGSYVIIPVISQANSKTKPTSGYGENITDSDGNSYKTIYIGKQQWMGENLKTSKYSDGTYITYADGNDQWKNNTTGAYCFYNNNDFNITKYGYLYNWYSVSSTSNGNKKICPIGWHIPNDSEWTLLTDYLGGVSVSATKLKSSDPNDWTESSKGTNESNFNAVSSGMRWGDGSFMNESGVWWSSTEANLNWTSNRTAWFRDLSKFNNQVGKNGTTGSNYSPGNIELGFSVRCLKD